MSFDDISITKDGETKKEANVFLKELKKDNSIEKETGEISTREWYVERRKHLYAPLSVTDYIPRFRIREDQILLIHGKPQFPIWLYGKGLDIIGTPTKVASTGVRGVLLGFRNPEWEQLYRTYSDAGLDVVIWNDFGNVPKDKEAIRKQAKKNDGTNWTPSQHFRLDAG
jgi:hypothetical protein